MLQARTLSTFIVVLTIATLPAHAQVPGYVPTNGLVGWWPFNGNANDESGNGNNGTINGATLTTDRYGVANAAYGFDGVDDYIEFEPGASSQLNVMGDITFCFWLRTAHTDGVILSFGDHVNPGVSGGYLAGLNIGQPSAQPGHLGYHINDPWSFSTTNVNTNDWRFILVRLSSDSLSLYIDGTMDGLALNMVPTASWSGNRRVGAANYVMSAFYNGLLDDIGIWDRALEPCEIRALYNGGVPGPGPTPVSYTGLDAHYNVADGPATLVGAPAGGFFVGAGVTGNSFDPGAAGVGSHSITYVHTDGCGFVNVSSLCTTVDMGVGIGGHNIPVGGGVRVFPNPNNGQFTVEIELEGLVSLQVFDAHGRLAHNEVFQATGTRNTRALDLGHLAKGSYVLRVLNDGQAVNLPVVVE